MVKGKGSRVSTQYTRKELVEKLNSFRRTVDNCILNLIYNPTSNKEVLTDMAKIRKEAATLPRVSIQPNLFDNPKKKQDIKKPKEA